MKAILTILAVGSWFALSAVCKGVTPPYPGGVIVSEPITQITGLAPDCRIMGHWDYNRGEDLYIVASVVMVCLLMIVWVMWEGRDERIPMV